MSSQVYKLKSFKCGLSVKVGRREEQFFEESNFELLLRDNIISIVDKRSGSKSFTTLFNVQWFTSDELNFDNKVPVKQIQAGKPSKQAALNDSQPSSI